MSTRRLFIALYPPPEVAERLLARAVARNVPGARWVQPDHVHLTVHFLGETDDRDLPRVSESVERAVAGLEPFTLSITGLISLPAHGSPRLIAARCDDNSTLTETHQRLVARLARPRRRSGGRYLPHLTLARFGPAGGPRHAAVWDEAMWIAFRVDHLTLVESTLRPDRAEHRPLARFPYLGR
ncbi:MAG: RNA 2',3'-cyclic phosphodiesterase [Phycisphaerae bacterium]|nr:MAG: RNA 2',3'-cyclic phosphodiesterase [Phycisphaerae bacterium]